MLCLKGCLCPPKVGKAVYVPSPSFSWGRVRVGASSDRYPRPANPPSAFMNAAAFIATVGGKSPAL